jgi:hypothetical protein
LFHISKAMPSPDRRPQHTKPQTEIQPQSYICPTVGSMAGRHPSNGNRPRIGAPGKCPAPLGN